MKVVLLILALACSCTSQKTTSEITYAFNRANNELTVKVKLPEGMHAYAPGEHIGKPVELVINAQNNWELAGQPALPTGDSKHLLDKQFEVKAKLKNGQGTIYGVFRMQLCSDTACERPQDYPFKVKP